MALENPRLDTAKTITVLDWVRANWRTVETNRPTLEAAVIQIKKETGISLRKQQLTRIVSGDGRSWPTPKWTDERTAKAAAKATAYERKTARAEDVVTLALGLAALYDNLGVARPAELSDIVGDRLPAGAVRLAPR